MFFRPVIEECRADSGVEPVQVDTKLVSEPLEVFLRRKAAPVYPFSNIITADEDNFIADEMIGRDALKRGADNYLTKSINFDYLEMCLLVDLAMRKK